MSALGGGRGVTCAVAWRRDAREALAAAAAVRSYALWSTDRAVMLQEWLGRRRVTERG
ncbi:hypothetical protein [Burkholderia latens]|uniref:hypothetical protein n=1 Tax=Burkholderia latens TaxID=488446 RepID=UPI0015889DC8|nr:hypothetical protein [Burkholderia latens]